MARVNRMMFDKHRHGIRDAHAKSARRLAYETSSRYRHEINAQPRVEPRQIDELPD